MLKETFMIDTIPCVLWGPASGRLLVAVHGSGASKTDAVIAMAADAATEKGMQVLSFDLPQHGGRREEPRLCDTQNGVEDLTRVMQYARTLSNTISLFGCSIGAYFSMLAYRNAPVQKALFLSPIVDMKRLAENMMTWFDVSEARLEAEREVPTPVSTLYWHDYQYVLRHPVEWSKPTAILYGEKDELSEYEVVKAFAERCKASLTVLEGSEHFFHTEGQLAFLKGWLYKNL